MEAPAAQLVGQTIAERYRVLRLVGEGGVGRVYEAEQVLGSSPRSVAVKLLRPEWSHDASVKARFHREAALVAKLQHVNTVRIYDFGATADGTLYIAMEFLRGRSLQQLLDERGALAPERVERIVLQVAGSLQEAHDLGIVHRDLKPDNILILDGHGSEHDVVKLLDFGIAKGAPSSGSALTKLTALGTFVGTPAYMSPEQFGGGPLGLESDIYSLGVTTHQMLAGRLPFDAQSALQWAQAHLGSAPPALAADYGAGTISERMRRTVLRALAKEPAQRPSSALQFAREFSGSAAPEFAAAPAPRAAPAASQVAEIEPRPAPMAPVPVAAAALSGGPRTAPMTRAPDFAQRAAAAVAPTLPVATPVPPGPAVAAPRRGFGVKALLAAAVVLGVAFFGLLAQQLGLFPESGPAEPATEPSNQVAAAPPVVIAPESPAASPEPSAPAVEPPPPATRSPAPKPPTRPSPAPPTTPAAPTVPGTPPATAQPPVLPGPATPPANPAQPPANPALPPGIQLPPGIELPPGVQLPPINLPSAQGACERCLETLRKGGNGSVVSAAADDLLCNDRAARDQCEAQIRDLSPAVAEQAARSGDCPAALATEAAGLRFGAHQESFRTVHTLCVR